MNVNLRSKVEKIDERKNSSQPGFEPGSKVPETLMLPLHHWDYPFNSALRII